MINMRIVAAHCTHLRQEMNLQERLVLDVSTKWGEKRWGTGVLACQRN
jgi:hypothetical protein